MRTLSCTLSRRIDCSAPAARYCLSGLPVDCQMKNITNPDQSSLLLEDLIIWTNYEIEVAAYNGAGRGTYSHKVTEWTLQGGETVLDFFFPSFFLVVFFLQKLPPGEASHFNIWPRRRGLARF